MKRFGIKVINLLLCLLTVTVTACKDEEETPFTVNEDGSVTINTQMGEIYSGGKYTVKNLFLTPAKGENFTVDVKLDFQPSGNYQTAGVILFLDEYNNFCVSRRSHSGFGGEILAYHGINDESFVEKAIFIKNGELIKLVDLEQERAAGGRSLAEIYISVM